jgi:hypothetical protein
MGSSRPSTEDFEGYLEAMIRLSPGLREAGVSSFAIGDVVVRLEDPQPKIVMSGQPDEEHRGDPLSDPMTFGRLAGGVPGYPRKEED